MNKIGILSLLFFSVLSFLPANLAAQERIRVKHNPQKVKEGTTEGNPLHTKRGALALESFDTFLPEGWKKITHFGGIGWQQGAVDSQVVGFAKSAIDAPPGGGNFIAYASWATGDKDGDFITGDSTDQWLITPQITNVQVGDSLRFYLRYYDRFGDNLDILISTSGDSAAAFDTLVAAIRFTGPGNNDWQPYSYALTDFVSPGDSIFIAFREQVSNTRVAGDALFLDLVEVGTLVTDVTRPLEGPRDFALHQNYPNPFNPTTKIRFSLSHKARVTLKVYNMLGQPVSTLLAGQLYSTGEHEVTFDAKKLPNGIYYYKMEAGSSVDIKKMTVLK